MNELILGVIAFDIFTIWVATKLMRILCRNF